MEKDSRRGEPSVQSVERAVHILHCFEEQETLSLTEISKMTGLHKSTTYGIVTTLKNQDMLYKDPATDKYRLGTALFRIASTVRISLQDVCMPYIQTLCDVTGETVNLVVRDGNSVMFLEKQESQRSIRSSTRIGICLPMYCTAVGKAILACLEPEDAAQVLDSTPLEARTKYTITDRAELVRHLEEVRLRGYAMDREELEEGLVCVAVPVFDCRGRLAAAISCSGPKQRMQPENVDKIARLLLKYTKELSPKLI